MAVNDKNRVIKESMEESEERLRLSLAAARIGTWVSYLNEDITIWDQCMCDIHGVDIHNHPKCYEQVLPYIHPDDLKSLERTIATSIREGKDYEIDHRIIRSDGVERHLFTHATILNDDQGSPHRIMGICIDTTDKKEAEVLIWKQANFDSLTELPNRRMLHDRLNWEISRADRHGKDIALMLLDLDYFKEVNDTLGHDVGDSMLIEAARRLRRCVRHSDTLGRAGGDEFIVVLGELDSAHCVERVAEDILNALAKPFELNGESAHISSSIGITFFPKDATKVSTLLKNADQAMYAAKDNGRNRFQYFTPSMQETAVYRMQLTNDLRSALKKQQFYLVYQPIVDLSSGEIYKAEALIRWKHPTRGLINPLEFISIAERTNIIVELGDWIFQQAIEQISFWRKSIHPNFQIAINTSPVQYRDSGNNIPKWIKQIETINLPGESVVMEITEGLLMDSHTAVAEKLSVLRDAGIKVALDDFGTGYSSLSYLKKFAIDYIKIDQSFVRNLSPTSEDRALCEAIIVMSHKLGIEVIAEGVETQAQKQILTEAGCDFGQGYLFSKPLPAKDLEEFFKDFL